MIFHWKSDHHKPIRSDAERERAAAQVDFLRAGIAKVSGEKPVAARMRELLRDREAEINDYDALKRGELKLAKIERLDQVAAVIPRIRIARGVSQTELARRLGVSKQVISRYEESDYQTVGLARLQEILDALGAKALIDLKAG
jgi:ribosome-binding protein aMBF1 (putative translation factor)